MKFKKCLCIGVTSLFFMLGIFSINIFASEVNDIVISKEIQSYINDLNVNIEELINLDENIDRVLEELEEFDLIKQTDDVLTVPISENIILTLATDSVETIDQITNKSIKEIKRSFELTNILGATIIKLNSIGIFEVSNNKVTVVDAYGTYSGGILWSLDYIKSSKGNSGSTSYASSSFKGELNIGIDPINVTIQSFNKVGTIYKDINSDWYTWN